MKKTIFILFLFMVILLFSGCSLQKLVIPLEESSQTIPEGMVAIVGKISLNPEPEQELKGLSIGMSLEEAYYRKAGIALSKILVDKIKDITESDWVINTSWDKYFVAVIPREDIYLITLEIVLKIQGTNDTKMYLNNPLLIDFEDNDKFIYIGNLEYYFGVENELGGKDNILKLVDNYDEVKTEYDGYVMDINGEPLQLEKRLLKGEVNLDAEVIETKFVYY